jgi:hypothetical protein
MIHFELNVDAASRANVGLQFPFDDFAFERRPADQR